MSPDIGPVATFGDDLAGLTYERFRKGWRERPERHLAFAARLGAHSVGLALIHHVPDGPEARLLSIAVLPPFRRMGIGTRLLERAAAGAAEAGATRLAAYHNSAARGRAAFEALLAGAGWPEPEEIEQRVAGRCGLVHRRCREEWSAFFAEKDKAGASIEPWSGVGCDEAAAIAAMIETGELPKQWDPAPTARVSHPGLSIAIRQAGRLAGWLFGEAVQGADQINYFNGFVFPGYRRAGWLIYGLIEVLGRQAEIFGPDSLAVYAAAADNRAMRGFMSRRLAGATVWTDIRFRSVKQISPSGRPDGTGLFSEEGVEYAEVGDRPR